MNELPTKMTRVENQVLDTWSAQREQQSWAELAFENQYTAGNVADLNKE